MIAFANTNTPAQRTNQMNTVIEAYAEIEGNVEVTGFTQMFDTPMVDAHNNATLEQRGTYYRIAICEHTGNVSSFRFCLSPKMTMWTNSAGTTGVSAYLEIGLTRLAEYSSETTVQQVVNSLTEKRALDIQLMTYGK